MRSARDRLTFTQLQGAVAEYCQVAGEPDGHSRALMDDLRNESPADWPWFLDYFKHQRLAILDATGRARRAA